MAVPFAFAGALGCQWLAGIDDIELSGDGGDAATEATACDVMCSGACVDLASDSKNCGACGHDCLGGECKASKCQPVMLASGQVAPYNLALNSNAVFWVEGTQQGAIMRCDKAGCGGQPTQLAPQTYPHAIAADETSVYWAGDDGTIAKCPVNGGSTTPLASQPTTASQPIQMLGLTVDATYVYWVHTYDGSNGNFGGVYRCPLDGGGIVLLNYGLSWQQPMGYLTTHAFDGGGGVYWTSSKGYIGECPLPDGCNQSNNVNELAGSPPQPNPTFITHDANNTLYWTNTTALDGGGAVMLMHCAAADGKCPTSIPIPLAVVDRPLGLAIDATDVYFTRPFDMSVWKCALSGCTGPGPTSLANTQPTPYAIAVDSTAIYWTNLGDGVTPTGSIMKLAK